MNSICFVERFIEFELCRPLEIADDFFLMDDYKKKSRIFEQESYPSIICIFRSRKMISKRCSFKVLSESITLSKASYPLEASSILPIKLRLSSIYEIISKVKGSSLTTKQLIFLSLTSCN